jgi:hypothetical protein
VYELLLLPFFYDGFFRRTRSKAVRAIRCSALVCAAITGASFGCAALSDEEPQLFLIAGAIGMCAFLVLTLAGAALVALEQQRQ